MASTISTSASNFDELRWVINIRRSLAEEIEEETEVPVSIFNVPKTLMLTDPESYIPQMVALGPYHYSRPELHEMERYKLAAAKRAQKHLHRVKFNTLVDNLMRFEPQIRACYHKYLHFNGETLAWMMAIDASFLLEFLQIYGLEEGKTLSRVSSRMSHLVDYAGRKSAHNSILRDIVMLENQIPLFILLKVLEIQYSSLELAHDLLASMLKGLTKELSPLKATDNLPKIDISNRAHVLDFLHYMVVPMVDEEQSETNEPEDHKEDQGHKTSDSQFPSYLPNELWNLVSKIKKGLIRNIKALLLSRPVRVLLTLPWKVVSNLPGFSMLKQLIEYLFFSQDKEEEKPENGSCLNKPPLAEEIAIPSVVDLCKSGVRFIPTNGNISSIKFDPDTSTFHLPTVALDINTKVVLRNLVAYETSNASGPLVFTRYTELMNGIIDTKEDVKLLSENGIIVNHLKNDEEAAELWNGMNKSIRLTKVGFLDKVIEDVNKYHNCRWNVKARKFFEQYVYASWQFLTLLAAIMLLILLAFQAFCSVYSCSRLLRIHNS
ncbi:hypothetical protein ES319_D06G137600v1 [Gossypium barbadense]|uniref:Uncharacterized protein n=2 Tax=Gossypium TaxID=3633 RepID=A0A5J5R391_GOSBA|nr:hypothetical protein ES319_D06G137600v1 [Gossypium barbadense]TYG64951.1 hypothetical protein ES288_D06G147000v1 [Gossypium darwinii]